MTEISANVGGCRTPPSEVLRYHRRRLSNAAGIPNQYLSGAGEENRTLTSGLEGNCTNRYTTPAYK